MESSVNAIEFIIPAIIFLALTVIPVRLAADMFGVMGAKYSTCTFAVLVGTILSYIILRELSGSQFSYALAFIALVVSFRIFLIPNIAIAVGLTVVAILIQILIVSALYSLGTHLNIDIAELLPFIKF